MEKISKQSSLTIVIPAYNEADSLPNMLPKLLAFCEPRGWKIIIINDGSKDDTRKILSGFENNSLINVFHHKVNRGYGGALKTGLAAVETDYAVTFDADGQHSFEDIDAMLNSRNKVDADLVIGWRTNLNRSNYYRAMGRGLILLVARMMLQINIHDLNSGFKLYNTNLVQKYLPLCPNSMAFSDIISLIFINEGHLVIEHPIEVKNRLGGKSTINTYTAVETILEIINITMLFNPLRFFLPMSASFIFAGIIWGIPIAIRGRGVSVGAMMAIVIGVIIFFLGLVAEQLSQLRKGMIARQNQQK